MQTIDLTDSCVCVSHDVQPREYVVYNGQIAGITDAINLERDSETLDRRPNEVDLHSDRVNRG
jgi:hypothetical protein